MKAYELATNSNIVSKQARKAVQHVAVQITSSGSTVRLWHKNTEKTFQNAVISICLSN